MSKEKLVAIAVAEDFAHKDGILTLSTGYRATIRPVSAQLLDSAMSRIKDPPVPEIYLEEKGRSEPNPNDPAYLKEVEEANHRRSMASVDVMILMGVQLIDPVPPESEWLIPLQQLERLGLFDLSPYDLQLQQDCEFVFKRFVAVGNEDLKLITAKMGITEADIKAAEASFPGNKA
jgi:hypothetical protein